MHAALVTNFTLESEDFMHSTAWFEMEVESYMNVTYSYNCQTTTRLAEPAYEEGLANGHCIARSPDVTRSLTDL